MIPGLTPESWDRMTPREREATAARIARGLPGGFAFRGIQTYRLGDQEHHIAEFDGDGSTFVLIPGGVVSIGYDADRPWEPTPEELQSWRETAEKCEIGRTIHEQIAAVTLRPRTVEIPPLLFEAVAREVGWEAIPLDSPEVRGILDGLPGLQERLRLDRPPPQIQQHRGGACIRVQFGPAGATGAQRARTLIHAGLVADLARSGFRLPTCDEWEYACGGGAGTLFRWGGHAPCERYPTNYGRDEAEWHRRWADSRRERADLPEGLAPDWRLRHGSNAFGIVIASDPYQCELVAEPGILRGGDAGCSCCGGEGFFKAWLVLATAYFEEDHCRREPGEPYAIGYTCGRRVLPLI